MVMRKALVAVLVAVAAGSTGLCRQPGGRASGSTSEAPAAGGMVAQLNFPAESDASIGGLVNYNPYAPKQQTKTWLYEPLMIQNSLDCKITPWLATGFKWEGANKLTFDIRRGREVERRLGLHRQRRGLHLQPDEEVPRDGHRPACGTTPSAPRPASVTANGNQVVFEFSGDAASKFSHDHRTADRARRSSYASVGDPTKYVDKEPVVHRSVQGRQLQRPPARAGPPPRLLAGRQDQGREAGAGGQLRRQPGRAQAAQRRARLLQRRDAQPAEDLRRRRTRSSTTSGTRPTGLTVLAPNLTKKPFSDVKFREALAYGMDKESATLKATYGIMDVASQSGLVLPAKKAHAAGRAITPEQHGHPVRPGQGQPAARRGGLREGRRRQADQPRRVAARASTSRCRPAGSTTRPWPTSSSPTSASSAWTSRPTRPQPDVGRPAEEERRLPA